MENPLASLIDAIKSYRPERVILFGSAARGDTDIQSDLDVIVIKETDEPFTNRLEAMANLCPQGVHADILVYTPGELQTMLAEGNPFITQALQEGKVIYEARP